MEALSPLDRNLATALVMEVLRWQLVLQQRIREVVTRSKGHLADAVQVSLELGALQLLLLDRVPAHAAIFESVELGRQSGNPYAVGLSNAVLRKLTQVPKLQESEASAAHPPWMVERWVASYGNEDDCRNLPLRPASFRDDSPCLARGGTGPTTRAGSFVARAWRTAAGEAARAQDEGSQLIAELAGRGTAILDCCAAPGGKTAILAERNPNANDHRLRHQSSAAQSHAGPTGRPAGKNSLPRS